MKLTDLEREELRHLQSRKKFLEMLVDELQESERAWSMRVKSRVGAHDDACVSIAQDGSISVDKAHG